MVGQGVEGEGGGGREEGEGGGERAAHLLPDQGLGPRAQGGVQGVRVRQRVEERPSRPLPSRPWRTFCTWSQMLFGSRKLQRVLKVAFA